MKHDRDGQPESRRRPRLAEWRQAWRRRTRRQRAWMRVERRLWQPPRWAGAVLLALPPLALFAWTVAAAGGTPVLRPAPAPASLAGRGGAPKEAAGEATADPSLALAREYLDRQLLAESAGEFQDVYLADRGETEALLGLASVAGRAGDHRLALSLARRVAKENPGDAAAATALGVAQARLGELPEASAAFQRAVSLSPEEWEPRMNAAVAHALLREWRAAEAQCRRAAELAPGETGPALMLAVLAFQQGKREQGAAQLERVLAREPEMAAVHASLGRVRVDQGKVKEGLAAFKRARELRREWAVPWLDTGLVLLEKKEYAEATGFLVNAQALAPGSVTVLLALARAREGLGQSAAAAATYEQVLALKPDLLLALNNLAWLYAAQGTNLPRAAELAGRAAAAHPRNPSVLDTLGWARYRAGEAARAVEPLEQAARLAPADGVPRYHLGCALLALGRRGESQAALREALQRRLPGEDRRAAEAMLAGGA